MIRLVRWLPFDWSDAPCSYMCSYVPVCTGMCTAACPIRDLFTSRLGVPACMCIAACVYGRALQILFRVCGLARKLCSEGTVVMRNATGMAGWNVQRGVLDFGLRNCLENDEKKTHCLDTHRFGHQYRDLPDQNNGYTREALWRVVGW